MDWKGQGPENHFKNELVGFELKVRGLRWHPSTKNGARHESFNKF